MRIAILSPLGTQGPEFGLIYFVARYLRGIVPDLIQLRCNGVFSVCDRDWDNGGKRDIHSCPRCMKDQDLVSLWAGAEQKNLSQFLSAQEVEETKRWITALPAERLAAARWADIALQGVCESSVRSRIKGAALDLNNKHHEWVLRRYYLSAARMICAAARFNNQIRPDLTLIPGGDDGITRAFCEQARKQRRGISIMRWDLAQRTVHVSHPYEESSWPCPFVVENIEKTRADVSTWPKEIINLLDEVLNFLGISEHQLSLPIAK